MSAIDTSVEAIEYLDWEYVEPCIASGCGDPAAHLVRVWPGPGHCLHEHWYAVCSKHTTRAVEGLAYCKDCKETLIVEVIRDL